MSLILKLGWRILSNPEALWVRLLKSIYYPNSSFFLSKKGSSPSWIWSSIYASKDCLSDQCCIKLGNGQSTKFWEDPWYKFNPNYKLNFNIGPRLL